jgi:hypothetical protein
MYNPVYEQARDNPAIRQAYCDEFLQKHPHPAVQAIVYQEESPRSVAMKVLLKQCRMPKHNFVYVITADIDFCTIGRGAQTTFYPSAQAFALRQPEFAEAFLSHEYKHAEDNQHGITLTDGTRIDYRNAPTIQLPLRIALLETRAYCKQVMKGVGLLARGRDDGRVIETIDTLHTLREAISRIKPKSDLEEQIQDYCGQDINSTLLCTAAIGHQLFCRTNPDPALVQ